MKTDILSNFLNSGHFLGFFVTPDAGRRMPLFYQVVGKEFSTFETQIGAAVIAPQAETGYQFIRDGVVGAFGQTKMLTPPSSTSGYQEMRHIFYGVNPSNQSARVFVNYEGAAVYDLQNRRNSAISAANNVGFIRGRDSPWNEPSPLTELFTVYDVEPQFSVFNNNPVGGANIWPELKFYIMKYLVKLVENTTLINNFIDMKTRVQYFNVGSLNSLVPTQLWMNDQITLYQKLGVKAL